MTPEDMKKAKRLSAPPLSISKTSIDTALTNAPAIIPGADFSDETLKKAIEDANAQLAKDEEARRIKIDKRKKEVKNLKNARKEKQSSSDDEVKIFVKLNKLNLAKKIATSGMFGEKRRNAVIDEADELLGEVETRIKSVALSKHSIFKEKRIKLLGNVRDEINDTIDDLSYVDEGYFEKKKNDRLGYGLDKRFVGLNVDEILKKVRGGSSTGHNKDYETKDTKSVKTEPIERESAESNTSPDTRELDKRVTKVEGEVEDLYKHVTAPDKEIEALKSDVNSLYEHITAPNKAEAKENANSNVNSIDDVTNKIGSNNGKIYEFLVNSGEFEAAEYILDLMTAPVDTKKTSEIEKQNVEIKKLSRINDGIYETLVKIEKNMIDEQDTSINLPVHANQQVISKEKPEYTEKDNKDESWFMSMLENMIGKELFSSIRGAGGSIVRFATSLARVALPFIGQALALGAAAYGGYKIGQKFFEMIGVLDENDEIKKGSTLDKFADWLAGSDEIAANAAKGISREELQKRLDEFNKKRWETVGKLNENQVKALLSSYYKNGNVSKREIDIVEKRAAELNINTSALKEGAIKRTSNTNLRQDNIRMLSETPSAEQSSLAPLNAAFNLPKPVQQITGTIDKPIDEYIKSNEGLSLVPYKDTEGKWTIGYGHLIREGEEYLMNGITKEQADEIFKKDFDAHLQAAKKIPGYNTYPEPVKDVLTDMTFNMGPSWYNNWPNTMAAMQAHDFSSAAEGMLNSKWAAQVGKRAQNNIAVIANASTGASPIKPIKNSPMITTEFNNDLEKVSKQNDVESIIENAGKERTMQVAEQNYRSVLTSTVRHESRGQKYAQTVSNNTSINNVNGTKRDINSFDIFDNLQSA